MNARTHWIKVCDDGGPEISVAVREHDNDRGYALGTLRIFGVPHHVECIEVNYDGGEISGANPIYASRITALENEFECRFLTVDFDRRSWVVFVTPHGD